MRRRIVVLAIAITTLVALAFLIPLAALVRELARDRVLAAAERDAQTVAQLASGLAPTEGLRGAIDALAIGTSLNGRAISVVFPDGSVSGAPIRGDEDISVAFEGRSLRAAVEGGEAVYVPIVGVDETAVVRIFAPDDELNRNVSTAWATLTALAAFLVAVAVVLADRLGRSIVTPVRDLSAATHRLGEGDLEARVEPSGPPEIEEVGGDFNTLATRLRGLLQRERETAADLSHRLRTPLTAARLDAEALDEGPQKERLLDDLGDLERTIDHIIREARTPSDPEDTDLAAVVRERAEFWGALAEEQGRRWSLHLPDRAVVTIARTEAEAAVDALLGNVFAHTPEGAGFDITVSTDDGVKLVLSDEGPGFSTSDPTRRGESSGSTGLGLDIVRRTAEEAGGSIVIGTSPHGGAEIIVSF